MKLWIAIAIVVVGIMWLKLLSPQPWCPMPIAIVGRIGLLALPVFAFAAIFILWRRYRLASLIPLAMFFVGLGLADKYLPSSVRLKLPPSATDVQEYYSDSCNGDYTRLVKARLPMADYPKLLANLHLKTRYSSATHGQDYDNRLPMNIGFAPAWWDPPTNLEECFFDYRPGDDSLRFANYAEGWAYYCTMSW